MKTESEGGGGGPRKGRFFDDLAGMAGGAFSAMAGARAEIESAVKSQVEMLVQRLELVRREDLDAALEVARRAREESAALGLRVAALEAKLVSTAPAPGPGTVGEQPPKVETAPKVDAPSVAATDTLSEAGDQPSQTAQS
jgi:BMFP domain-containing protein YqiC